MPTRSIRAPISVQLSGDDGPADRTHRRPAGALPRDRQLPKIIKTDTELEFYQGRASLVATDTAGNAAHDAGQRTACSCFPTCSMPRRRTPSPRSRRTCTFPSNPLYAGPPLRALLIAIGLDRGRAPPPASRYPSRADGTLVSPTAVGISADPRLTNSAT